MAVPAVLSIAASRATQAGAKTLAGKAVLNGAKKATDAVLDYVVGPAPIYLDEWGRPVEPPRPDTVLKRARKAAADYAPKYISGVVGTAVGTFTGWNMLAVAAASGVTYGVTQSIREHFA